MTQLPFPQLRHGEGAALGDLVAADGTVAHAHARALTADPRGADARDLADAVHLFCLLHGRHPGVIDHAALRTTHDAARTWLIDAGAGFAAERAMLVKLAAAVGPLPSTPGQASVETALITQRHALDTLARSDRAGCAIGAALALALDWQAVRQMLAVAAARAHVELPAPQLPPAYESGIVAALLAEAPAVERALIFGGGQLLAQHRALWTLLEARAAARGEG